MTWKNSYGFITSFDHCFAKMLFLNLLILLGVSSGVLSNEDAKCNPLLDEADKCFTKILFLGDYNAKPVTDEVQMTQHCK